MKTCTVCKEEKSFDDFHRNRRTKDGRRSECKKCIKIKTDKWYLDNGDKARAYQRDYSRKNRDKIKARQYGITEVELSELYDFHEGRCGICRSQVGSNKLYVDHCHSSGRVRKLLCLQCNTGLGNFKDDPEILKAAIDYLNQHR